MGTMGATQDMPPDPNIPTVALAHRDLGGTDFPPLVILHGMLGSSRNWQTAGSELAGRRRVHALDLRNHGQSPHADSMSYAEMAADVVAWLDSRRIWQTDLMGHSMGGKVAMLLACRTPERVGRLTVVDTAPRDYYWPAHRDEFAAMSALDLGAIRSRAEAEARMEDRIPNWAMRKFIATNLERVAGGGWKWQFNLPAIRAALPELEKNPLLQADRFPGPALFVAGGKSAYVQPGDRGAILGHFPSATIVTLPDSGHNPHIESREAFVRAVESAP